MSSSPVHRPRALRRAPVIGAVLCTGLLVAGTWERARSPELSGLAIPAVRTEAVEIGWVDAALGRSYLAVPPPESPCPSGLASVRSSLRRDLEAALRSGDQNDLIALHRRDPDHWLPATVLALVRISRGSAAEATSVVSRVVGGRRAPRTIARALEGGELRSAEREEAVGTLHLLHLHGWLLLAQGRYGPELWRSQRSAILLGDALADESGRVPAAGCAVSTDSLTTVDLRTNLLVAYLTAPSVEYAAQTLEEDLEPRAGRGPLGAVIRARGASSDVRSDGWWRAVALAVDLSESLERGTSVPPRTALDLAQLALEAIPLVGGAERDALLDRAEAWWTSARRGVGRLPAGERGVVNRVLERTMLALGVYRGRPIGITRDGSPEMAQLVRRLEAAWRGRVDVEAWSELVAPGKGELEGQLGPVDDAWSRAGRLDVAIALARAGRDPRPILASGDPRPMELVDLAPEKGFAGLGLFQVLGALLLGGLAGRFLSWLVQPWFDLEASAYRREAAARLEDLLR